MKLDKKKQSLLITLAFSVVFGALMTFWGLGKESENKMVTFLLYAISFGILHRIMSNKWK